MARQHTTSQSFKSFGSIGGAALTGLGLLLLFGTVDLGAAQLSHLLCATAWEALRVLPSAVLATWQASQPYTIDHQPFSPCPLQMLALSWPLLHVIARAA